MKHVKWVMFNLHFWNCWLDLTLSTLSQPFIIPPVFGGFFLGMLGPLGINMKLQVYMMVTQIMMVAVATIAIFENRFFLLFAENTFWRHGRKLFYVINYSLALSYFLPTVLQIPDQELARKEIFKMYPSIIHFDRPSRTIYVVAYDMEIREWIGYRQLISLCTVIVQGATFLILLHFNIWKSTKNMTMSETTLRLQKVFLRAVYLQIAIPATVMIIPQIIMEILGYLYLMSPEMNSIAYMLMSVHGASATLVMLYFHAPYREFCQKVFCKKVRVLNGIESSQYVETTASNVVLAG
ncbi:hypothetical protein L5515_009438 [Caenorhabditis briggsae]|uniref:Serpentine Receptor, class H n=1 Tax=Caenorhabditis briggsae TaxID=6238 RepID=A0AAE9JM91_CAEBR|nr:hypothetical protein L5515_009438 [Caenorhabditis briggsae]